MYTCAVPSFYPPAQAGKTMTGYQSQCCCCSGSGGRSYVNGDIQVCRGLMTNNQTNHIYFPGIQRQPKPHLFRARARQVTPGHVDRLGHQPGLWLV